MEDPKQPKPRSRRIEGKRLHMQRIRASRVQYHQVETPPHVREAVNNQFHSQNKPPEVTKNAWKQRRHAAKNKLKMEYVDTQRRRSRSFSPSRDSPDALRRRAQMAATQARTTRAHQLHVLTMQGLNRSMENVLQFEAFEAQRETYA
jgi:hypothetical protein